MRKQLLSGYSGSKPSQQYNLRIHRPAKTLTFFEVTVTKEDRTCATFVARQWGHLTGAALFEALVYGKRPIATLVVTFRHRSTHSLHDYIGLTAAPEAVGTPWGALLLRHVRRVIRISYYAMSSTFVSA